jgi:hypothetical protein
MSSLLQSNIFIAMNESLEKQIDSINNYTLDFKKKYADFFENDTDDSLIDISRSLPTYEDGIEKLYFNIKFGEGFPEELKAEFSDGFNQYLIN